jgi:hypothetical protein
MFLQRPNFTHRLPFKGSHFSGETTRQPASLSKVTWLRVVSPLEPWPIKRAAGESEIRAFFFSNEVGGSVWERPI